MQIVVFYILCIVLFAIWKKVNAYEAFLTGVENSFKTILTIFPNILAIIFAINVFLHSGIMELLSNFLSKINIIPEIIMQCILKPISWSSSLLMMSKVFETYGVDSKLGALSTLIQGGSDTTIYIVALYFSSIKMKKTGHTIWVGILTDITIFIVSYVLIKLL